MNLRHRVHIEASPTEVWQVLGYPQRWPEFELPLLRVRGAHGRAVAGQHLMATGRGVSLQVPIDVLEAEPDRRLVLRVRPLPGVVAELTYAITPVVRGGCDLSVSVVVDGLFARLAALPTWLSAGVSARVLALRVQRPARRVANGAA